MTNAKYILAFKGLIITLVIILSWQLSSYHKSPEQLKNYSENELRALIGNKGVFDGKINWNGFRAIQWEGAYIPTDINPKLSDGIHQLPSGTYWIETNQQGALIQQQFGILSRNFSITNQHTAQIKKSYPFLKVAPLPFPTANCEIEILGETHYAEKNPVFFDSHEIMAMRICTLVLLLSCIFPAFWIKTRFASPVFLAIPYAFFQFGIHPSLLEVLGIYFQPLYYASSEWMPNIASVFLLNTLLFGITRIKQLKKSFLLSLLLSLVTSGWVLFILPKLIRDGVPFPEVNLPYDLSLNGTTFWLALSTTLIPFISTLFNLPRPENKRTEILIFISSALLFTWIMDLLSFKDLIFVYWPIACILLCLLLPKLPTKWPITPLVVLVIFSAGLNYSIQKYLFKQHQSEATLLLDQLGSKNDINAFEYLLNEEWKANQSYLQLNPDSLGPLAFIQKHILVGYLAQLQATLTTKQYAENGVHRSQDSLFIKNDNQCFFLSRKPLLYETGIPGLVADRSWQIQANEKLEFAQFNQGILTQKSAALQCPNRLKNFEDWISSNPTAYEVFKQKDGALTSFVLLPTAEYGFLGLRLLAVFALILALYILLIEIPKYYNQGLNLGQRIRISVLGMCLISALLLSFMGYKNLQTQFTDQNQSYLNQNATGIQRYLSEFEDEIWTGNLLLVQELQRRLVDISNKTNTDISFYQLNGDLAASSEPLLFSSKIKSTKIPYHLVEEISKKATVINQQERIGNLEFLSLYTPFFSASGEMLGILNIPLFARQEILNKEVRTYTSLSLQSLVFAILIALILGQLLSYTVSKPIRGVKEALNRLNPAEDMSTLAYDAKDEIGALVEAYNDKVHQLKLLLEEIAKNEREMAWKHMAQQVAHEIKNPLTPIKLKTQWLQSKLGQLSHEDLREKSQDLFETILDQTELLKNIASEFSEYAALNRTQPEALSFEKELLKVTSLFEQHQEVTITTEIQEPFTIWMDPLHFKRVFTNLIKNAVQAKKEEEPLQISISATSIEKSSFEVTVIDNGTGIPNENLKNIFQPNFTTKSSGTGLGLSMVKTMLSSASAEISVQSNLGEGSCFRITFKNKI